MKRICTAVALCGTLLAGAVAADPVAGTWKTEVDEGAYAHVDMAPCGDRICGVISRTFNAAGEFNSESRGRRIVWDMMPTGGGAYGDGRIWQPSTGKVYASKMALAGDVLTVRGCVGPFCKKQVWTRID